MVCARALPYVGGIETHVDEVSRRLVAAGVPVTVITTDPTGHLPVHEELAGVRVHRLPAWPRNGDLYVAPALARAIRAASPDVVHMQGAHTFVAPMALAAAQRAGLPNLLTFHTGGHSGRLRHAARAAQWRSIGALMRRADALVAVSEFEAALFSRQLHLPAPRIRLIRNGADVLPVDPHASVPTGDPLLVSVGRLERYKGHQRVVAAMPAVLAEEPGARLVIVGRGPFEGALRAMATDLGVAGAVELTSFGPEDRGALGALVASASVVALLSDYEAHPVAVLEALALGRPVVVADTSGLSELAGNRDVTAVARQASPVAVARALLAAARGRAPVPGAGRMPALRSWDDCAADLLSLYRESSG